MESRIKEQLEGVPLKRVNVEGQDFYAAVDEELAELMEGSILARISVGLAAKDHLDINLYSNWSMCDAYPIDIFWTVLGINESAAELVHVRFKDPGVDKYTYLRMERTRDGHLLIMRPNDNWVHEGRIYEFTIRKVQ